jgi:hypothetical protein
MTISELIALVSGLSADDVKYVRFAIAYTDDPTITPSTNTTGFVVILKNIGVSATLTYKSKEKASCWIKNNRPSADAISFLYEVNSNQGRNILVTNSTEEQYTTERYYTSGLLKLPANYDPVGEPVKLIIFCHGSADYSSMAAQAFSTNYEDYLQYLVDEGYALFDCYGWSSKYNVTSGNMATSTSMDCLTQGYKWVTDNFNIDKKGVFVSSKSLGGLNAVSLCFNKGIPVLACAPLAPELNQLHVNLGYTAASRLALANDFGFEGETATILGGGSVTVDETYTNYLLANASKMIGYNPFWCGLVGVDISTLVGYGISPYAGDILNSNWATVSRICNVPMKIWVAADDTNVSYDCSKNFIQTINNAQGIAELRTMPSGTGGHHSVDTDASAPKVASIVTRLGISHTNVPLAYVEMVNFFRRYEN